jgi:protocatechuate 3,4-dioxygenase beta subunit
MVRTVLCFVAVLLGSSVVSAQVPGVAMPGQPPLPPRPVAPPRDNPSPRVTGTAILRGRVVAADSGQPLRRAQVRLLPNFNLNGPGTAIISGPGAGRATSTDANGRYEFKDLAAGRYSLSASKGSYINLSYGQRRPNEPGKPLEVVDGQTIEKVDFALPRGAIVTGRVLDELGEPAENIQIALMQPRTVQGRSQLSPTGRTVQSNDLGEFRIVAVPPGQYYLSASSRSIIPLAVESDDRSGYAPTYYPGTASLAEAQRLTLAVGQTLSDMTMTLVAARMAHIAGFALDSQGRPMTSGNITLTQRVNNGPSFTMGMGGMIKADGSFALPGLAPGDYIVSVSTLPASPGDVIESATTKITLAGQDIDGLQLVASRLSTLSGRVLATDNAQAQALRPSSIRLNAMPKDPDPLLLGPGLTQGRVNEDGTFTLTSRPGSIRINMITDLSANGSAWTLKAVRVNGVDVTDSGFDVGTSQDIGGIEVELTNRVSSLSGHVTNGRGETLMDYSAIVFSQDRERWTDTGRYFRTGRPDQEGRYKVTGLPAGEYFAIALETVDPNETKSPEFLERASRSAIRFSLDEDETKSVDLKLVAGL